MLDLNWRFGQLPSDSRNFEARRSHPQSLSRRHATKPLFLPQMSEWAADFDAKSPTLSKEEQEEIHQLEASIKELKLGWYNLTIENENLKKEARELVKQVDEQGLLREQKVENAKAEAENLRKGTGSDKSAIDETGSAVDDMIREIVNEKLRSVELMSEVTSLRGRRAGSIVVCPDDGIFFLLDSD